MKFASFANVLVLASISSLSSVLANPVNLEARDAYSPVVLTPVDGELWKVGTMQMVTWDAFNAPPDVSNPIGEIFLRKDGVTTSVVLAKDFPITQGYYNVMVPDVPYGNNYSVNVFGSSGSISGMFTIFK